MANVLPFQRRETDLTNSAGYDSGRQDVTDSATLISSEPKSLTHLRSVLLEVFRKAKLHDWDGNGADPIPDSTYYNTSAFLENIPEYLRILNPEITPDVDGFIEIEWRSGRRTFSLYVTDADIVLYAGFYGKNDRLSGRFSLEAPISQSIQENIKQVYEGQRPLWKSD